MKDNDPWLVDLPDNLELAKEMYRARKGNEFWDNLEVDMYELIGNPGDWNVKWVLIIYLLLEVLTPHSWSTPRGEFKIDDRTFEFIKHLLVHLRLEGN